METTDLIDFILAITKGIGCFIFLIAMCRCYKDIDDMGKRVHDSLEKDFDEEKEAK